MASKIDLTGQTFARLTVERFSHRDQSGSHWHCKCICGKEVVVRGVRLRNGSTKSCGCLRDPHKKGVSNNRANICIDCKKSVGLCPWSAVDQKTGKLKFEPVPGWTATKTKMRCSGTLAGAAKYVDTYSITACPLFEKDERGDIGNNEGNAARRNP